MVQKTYSVGGLGGSRYTAMAILMRYMMTVGFSMDLFNPEYRQGTKLERQIRVKVVRSSRKMITRYQPDQSRDRKARCRTNCVVSVLVPTLKMGMFCSCSLHHP